MLLALTKSPTCGCLPGNVTPVDTGVIEDCYLEGVLGVHFVIKLTVRCSVDIGNRRGAGEGAAHLMPYVKGVRAAAIVCRNQARGRLMGRPGVVLLSGGLDSTTTLAIARAAGHEPHALTFRYGQRHSLEVEAARRIAQASGVERHVVADIDLRMFGGSALTAELAVPKGRDHKEMSAGIPITYVPARNTIFLAFALAWAEVLEASDIFLGINAVDYSGYPDCRPAFVRAFESLARLATKAAVEGKQDLRIHTPLIDLTKGEIIRRGLELGVDYGLTRSCYDPDDSGVACGQCDSCQIRLGGFAAAGVEDPVPYQVIGTAA